MSHDPAVSRWHQSLYWRVALGLVAFLALMLAAQSALFVWVVEQTAGSIPARSPRRLAVIVASDIAAAVADDPAIDLPLYLREQYAHVFQPFVIVMRDGRVVSNRGEVPLELREAVAAESARVDVSAREGRSGRFSGPEGRRPPNATGSAPLPPERSWESAPILVAGTLVGRVAVFSGPPLA